MQQHELLEFLLNSYTELAALNAAAAATIEQACSMVANYTARPTFKVFLVVISARNACYQIDSRLIPWRSQWRGMASVVISVQPSFSN